MYCKIPFSLSLRILGNNFRFFLKNSSNAAVHVWKYIFSFHFRFRKPTVSDYSFCRSWSSQHMFVNCYWITNRQIEFQKLGSYHMWYVVLFVFTRIRFRTTYLLVSTAKVHATNYPTEKKNMDSSECIQNRFMTSVENPFRLPPFHLWLLHASSNAQSTAMSNKIQKKKRIQNTKMERKCCHKT